MGDLINTILNIGITAGLSDRDNFVKSVSGIIEKYQDDPARAEKLSRALIDYMEQMRNNINTRNSFKSAITDADFANKENITELTLAIKELTSALQKKK